MIKVEYLSFTYPKFNESVLKHLNFEINEGEIFGFLGPSGNTPKNKRSKPKKL